LHALRSPKGELFVPSQPIIAQTLILAFRIAFVWAGGILLAVASSALIPKDLGFTFTSTYYIPFNRLGFWTCIWAAVTVTILVVIRAMLADFTAVTPP
jgi:hypothetical protein